MSAAKKRIAVTGANGFLGRYVIRALEQSGAEVLPLSRRDFDIHGDKPPSYDEIGQPDTLIHLAWGHLSDYRNKAHFESELPAHYRFLKHLAETGLPALVVAGTCQEYGMQSGELCEDSPTNPHMPYGYAKDALRRQLQFLQKDADFNMTWARLFYTYGEGQSPKSLLPQLKAAAEKGHRLVLLVGDEPFYGRNGFRRVPRGRVALRVRVLRGASCGHVARPGHVQGHADLEQAERGHRAGGLGSREHVQAIDDRVQVHARRHRHRNRR